MKHYSERTAKTIRIMDDVYYQARVAAVRSRKSLGQWLEGAILEKLEREVVLTSPLADGEDYGARELVQGRAGP